ncbi:MAG: hypothetical protein ACD_58C00050G0006 [uncultured bacterium]|nr:MAG: hypothetical protein ACD_58C00050G0006 [uncultured bacterium]
MLIDPRLYHRDVYDPKSRTMGTGPYGSCVIDCNCGICLFRPKNDSRIIGPCGNVEIRKSVCSECFGKNKWQLDESLCRRF